MPENYRSFGLPVLGFIFLVQIGSLDTALKYGGVVGIGAYLVLSSLIFFLGFRFIVPKVIRLSDRTANAIALCLLIVFVIATFVLYPIANSSSPGVGSDADDALIIAGLELVNGNFPYYQPTYLGNPISPMPGAVIFAIPFVVAGILPLQNIFWLGALFFLTRHIFRSSAMALVLTGTILIMSPTLWQNLITASDYASNSIYILVLTWLLVNSVSDNRTPKWQTVGIAILLGIGLSSRSNFLLVIPVLFSVLAQSAGCAAALRYLMITGLAFSVTTLPFLLYDPAHFGPLTAQSGKMSSIESVLPFATVVIPMIGFGLAGALSIQRMEADCRVFFRNCAIVQAVVLLFTSALHSIHLGRLDLYVGQSGYGMFTIFFAAVAGWMTYFTVRVNRDTISSY